MRKTTAIALAFALGVSGLTTAAAHPSGHGGFGHGYGGYHGWHGGPGVGVYFGGPYFGWPYPYPYGYYDPYGYYYPYDDYPYGDVPPAAPQNAAPAVPQQQNWYYCDAPKGYYPYVRTCTHNWETVPASPPPR